MNKLSGDKNVDMLILMNLNDGELAKVCEVNKYIHGICQNRDFWNMRIRMLLNVSQSELHQLRNYLNLDGKELYVYLVTKDIRWEYKDLLILFLLKYQNVIDEIVQNAIPQVLPKYINKQEYIYFLRATIAKYFVERRVVNVDSFYPEEDFLTYKLETRIPRIINNIRVPLPRDMTAFVDKYIKERLR